MRIYKIVALWRVKEWNFKFDLDASIYKYLDRSQTGSVTALKSKKEMIGGDKEG
jgi:hypothetical protein